MHQTRCIAILGLNVEMQTRNQDIVDLVPAAGWRAFSVVCTTFNASPVLPSW